MNRRHFLGYGAASLLAGTLGGSALLAAPAAHAATSSWRMPDEGEPHAATWLASRYGLAAVGFYLSAATALTLWALLQMRRRAPG